MSTANEELDKWEANLLKDAKDKVGYDKDSCDQACKDKFDADWQADLDKEKVEIDKLKGIIKYDDVACDTACKAAFQAELLKWLKATYESC